MTPSNLYSMHIDSLTEGLTVSRLRLRALILISSHSPRYCALCANFLPRTGYESLTMPFLDLRCRIHLQTFEDSRVLGFREDFCSARSSDHLQHSKCCGRGGLDCDRVRKRLLE